MEQRIGTPAITFPSLLPLFCRSESPTDLLPLESVSDFILFSVLCLNSRWSIQFPPQTARALKLNTFRESPTPSAISQTQIYFLQPLESRSRFHERNGRPCINGLQQQHRIGLWPEGKFFGLPSLYFNIKYHLEFPHLWCLFPHFLLNFRQATS